MTSLHFAKVCHGTMVSDLVLPNLQYLVPADRLKTEELVRRIARITGQDDITIPPRETEVALNFTIATPYPDTGCGLRHAAGYDDLLAAQVHGA